MLEREHFDTINKWLKNGNEALMLVGARQIGKTYLIRECIKQSDYDLVEFNFIENPELAELFQKANTTSELLARMSLLTSTPLTPHKTVIFFDEIQQYSDIVTRIKFLVEEGSFKYIMSGSLLGVELHDIRSYPVGYMRIIDMYPLNFKEFCKALKISDTIIQTLYDAFNKHQEVDDFIHQKMLQVFYLYLIIGGMPEAVETYVETNNLKEVELIHQKIIRLYKEDFTRYEPNNKFQLREIYDSIPSQINEQNKRFKISKLGDKSTFSHYENQFLWLKEAGVALPIYNVTSLTSPLIINTKRNLFKLFLSDVGLLTSYYPLDIKMKVLNYDKNIANGALFENAVAQLLIENGFQVYYYTNKAQGEVDFVIELNGNVTPIEVKSGKNYKRHSALQNILETNPTIKQGYVLSNANLQVEENKIYLPIYMCMFIKNQEMSNEQSIFKLELSDLQ